MPIIRHGYATRPNRDTWQRAQNRRTTLTGATTCALCGQPATQNDPLEAGHIIPVADGGPDELWNLQPEHRSCNRRQGRGAGVASNTRGSR